MTTNNNQELFEDTFEFYITEQNEGERIDKYLSDMLSSYSRSYLQKLIGDGFVLVNNNIIKEENVISNGRNNIVVYLEGFGNERFNSWYGIKGNGAKCN